MVDANQIKENLFGVAIRCGQDLPDEYGKKEGQEVKQGDITTRPSLINEGSNLSLPKHTQVSWESREVRHSHE